MKNKYNIREGFSQRTLFIILILPENRRKVKRNVKKYLKSVVFCGEAGLPEDRLDTVGGFCWPEDQAEGILFITDRENCLKVLKDKGLPVAAWLHEDNQDQDLSEAVYAIENPQEVEQEFYERIYRREKGIPWDILETERCLVREMIPQDAEAFAAIYQEENVSRYLKDFHGDAEGERRYIEEYQQQYQFYEYGVWSVVLKETGEVIGRVGFSEAENNCERSEAMNFRGTKTGKLFLSEDDDAGNCLPVQDCNGKEGVEWLQFGYVIGVPWQGCGLAYEVCRAILLYAAQEWGVRQISLVTEPENEASLKLAQKLGFQF